MDKAHSSDARALHPAPGVVATDLGDELILLDPMRGAMFSLNETGRFVWQALERGTEPVDALTATFDVDAGVARAEVHTLIAALVRAGLLVDAGAVGDGSP